jgi:hypothetical protein
VFLQHVTPNCAYVAQPESGLEPLTTPFPANGTLTIQRPQGPAALAAGSEDGLVRAIMADAAPRLAVGEVSELIRSTRSALDQRQKQDDAAFPGYGLWP